MTRGVFSATDNAVEAEDMTAETTMRITVGSKGFTATLEDNTTVEAFKRLLPVTLEMTDLNGNEKYYHLATPLPTDAARPGKIQAGDLMLYEDNSLVLFYKTFKTSYSYTRIGRIINPDGLAGAAGTGDASVTFELE